MLHFFLSLSVLNSKCTVLNILFYTKSIFYKIISNLNLKSIENQSHIICITKLCSKFENDNTKRFL